MAFSHQKSCSLATVAITSTVLSLLGAGSAFAQAPHELITELITNGDFETGSFTGWNRQTSGDPADTGGSRDFYLSTPGSDTPTDNGNTAFATTANPEGGSFYAVSNANFAGESVLYQAFTLDPTAIAVSYSFQLFVNDQSGFGMPSVDPSGLDYTTGGTFNPNQHARVDILRGGTTNLFSTDPADIVTTLYAPNVDSSNPAPYLTFSGDLTSVLTPGQSYVFRVGEVDNYSALNVGVDNVSIVASVPVVVPEASPLFLLALGLPMLGGMAARARRQRVTIESIRK